MWHISDADLVILTVKIFLIGMAVCAVVILFGALIAMGIDEARKARRQRADEEAKLHHARAMEAGVRSGILTVGETREITYARGVAQLLVDEPRQLVETDTQVLRFEDRQRGRDRESEFRNFTKIVTEIKK